MYLPIIIITLLAVFANSAPKPAPSPESTTKKLSSGRGDLGSLKCDIGFHIPIIPSLEALCHACQALCYILWDGCEDAVWAGPDEWAVSKFAMPNALALEYRVLTCMPSLGLYNW